MTIRSGRRRPPSDEDGSVSVELVVATPLLLVLLLVVIQAALWWHATHIAGSAAAHALAAARVRDGTAAAGQAAGERVLAQLAGQLLTDTRVEVTRDTDRVHADVRGRALPVIPGASLPVTASVTGAAEPPP